MRTCLFREDCDMDDLIDVIEGQPPLHPLPVLSRSPSLHPPCAKYSMALSDIQLHLLHDCLSPCGGWSWCSLKQHDPKVGH